MAQYELNLRDYWQIIKKRRWGLIVTFFAVLFVSIIYTNLQEPVYQAVAQVQWVERKTLGSLLTEMVTIRTGDPLIAQSRIITSLPVLESVVIDLGLVTEGASSEEVTNKARVIREQVFAEAVPDTNIIRIIVTDKNPAVASVIANRVAKTYIEENLKEKSKQSRSVREFIEKQLLEADPKLKEAEDALARFKEKEVPTGVAITLQNRLSTLEQDKHELLRLYTANHPDVADFEKEINKLKEELKALPQSELMFSRLIREVEVNTKIYRELKDRLEAARISEAEKIADVSLVEPAIPPSAPVRPKKSLNYGIGAIMGLMLGLSFAFVWEQLDTSIGTIEDVEAYLKLPVLGVIPYLKGKEEEKRSVIKKIFPRKLGSKDKLERVRSQLLLNYSTTSPVFEAYRILRTNIQTEVFKDKQQGHLLLLTSSGPEEGKSITICNVGITMAQGGLRTLLVDTDMRRSSIHKIFGLKNRTPGLSDILRGTAVLKDSIRTFTDILMGELGFDEALKVPGLDNLNVLTSGSMPSNPAELLLSREMSGLLDELRSRFDLILFDSPPVLAVADAVILAPKTDGVILIYQVGKTARSILLRVKNQLAESGAQVRGEILNNISPELEVRYGYHYHYKYYGKYYGDKKEEA
ncbi:MAG: GNVR domain-containing protein [Candidatus Omnitrophota bacterium]